MSNFTHRDVSEHERWMMAYEELVASLADGFDMCIYEYTNGANQGQSVNDESLHVCASVTVVVIELKRRRPLN